MLTKYVSIYYNLLCIYYIDYTLILTKLISIQVTTVDSLEPVFLFVKPLDLEKLAASGIVPPFSPSGSINSSDTLIPPYQFKGRIGRGGRIVFDRWNPISQTPIGYNNFSTLTSATSMS